MAGRKRLGPERDKWLTLKLAEDEKRALERAAADRRISQVQVVRSALQAIFDQYGDDA